LALTTFKKFIAAQGGDVNVIEHPEILPTANYVSDILAEQNGYVVDIAADKVGLAAMLLGAGRVTKDSLIDLAVGIILHKKVGDKVQKGDSLLSIYSNRADNKEIADMVRRSYTIVPQIAARPGLIYAEVE
jgi:pyrimidine-nucleoside phosphorylase